MDRLTLAEVVADPDRLEDTPLEELPDLLAELERLRAEVWTRLMAPVSAPTGDEDRPDPDQLLDAEAVADILDVNTRYVYDHAEDWPFTRRISSRKLRFSERGLYRWLNTRACPPPPAASSFPAVALLLLEAVLRVMA